MNKILTNIVIIGLTLMGLNFVFTVWTGQRFMDNSNACHAQLHIGERIHQPMDRTARDAMLTEYGKCIKERSNFIDLLFQKRTIDTFVEALKTDPAFKAQ